MSTIKTGQPKYVSDDRQESSTIKRVTRGPLESYTGGQKLQNFMFLKSSDDYAPAQISSAHKYTWPLAKKIWASTGKLPHKSISEMNTHIKDPKVLRDILLKLSLLVINHHLDLVHTRNLHFNSTAW